MEFKLDLISMRQVAIRCNLYNYAHVPRAKDPLSPRYLFGRDQQRLLAHPQVRFRRVLKRARATLVPVFNSPEMKQHLQVKLAHVAHIQKGGGGGLGSKGGRGAVNLRAERRAGEFCWLSNRAWGWEGAEGGWSSSDSEELESDTGAFAARRGGERVRLEDAGGAGGDRLTSTC
jgi:hypothetical protein